MSLDKKRKELELGRVEMARRELEFRIMEYEEQIVKLQEHIKIQLQKEAELKQELGK